MPVAEIFLSAFMQVLFDRLASRELLEFATRQGIHPRLIKLEANLKMITKVISHAENVLFRDTEVDEWLEELRDWAYDADDFLDEANTRAMQQQQQMKEEAEEEEEARRNNTTTSVPFWSAFKVEGTKKVRGFLNPRGIVSGFNSGKQYSKDVDELNSRLDTISQRMEEMRRLMKMTLGMDNTTSTKPVAISQRRREAPAEEFDARVFGREQDKEKIIEQLSSSSGDTGVEVIPIVGMPGIGKTTLARHVFDSVSVQQQEQEPPLFDIKGWVCVSDDFDVKRITRDIFESFTSRAPDSSELNQLQSELKAVIGGKRFLLVLDDVWTRNYLTDWSPLRSPFRVGAPGSKILVTTRDDKVASMVQTDDPMKIHHPGPLCNDDCWSVFLQHVIDKRDAVFESEAGPFRKKILDRCKGLPLTAKLLAGLLRGESPGGQRWEAVLNNSIWDLSENELSGKGDLMLPAVMLSYFHLPPQLKRCFSYCAVLPKDYQFEEEDVVMMWMAQGLVLPERGEQVEVTGATYFRELVSRSLFQPSPTKSRFLMHDLISDMAEIVAGKSCFKIDGDLKIDNNPPQARHSSYRNLSGLKTEFEAFERTKYLREFQSFDERSFGGHNLTAYVPLELLMKLKYLRVLCLSRYYIRELPKDIGDLIHLRLVDLSYTYIRSLPESMSSLYNLQALKLKACWKRRMLPVQMRKLVNLRILDCSGFNKLVSMPVEMRKLTSLQKLSNFIVGQGLKQGIGQLKYLPHLKGSISISFLENVRDSKEAREANLKSKEGLQSLELEWNPGDLQAPNASFHVFEELQPHKLLEKLIIRGYGGPSFPGWVGDDRFSKMRVIELADCGKCTSLPPVGKLPVLEKIRIRKMAGIECVGEEFYGKERGAFPSLKILEFWRMENWSTWLFPAGGGGCFACLQELHIMYCTKLSLSLPDGINVKKLIVRKCDKLLVPLPRQSILKMDIAECKVELMPMGCLNEDGRNASQLRVEEVDVAEAAEPARMRTNIIVRNKGDMEGVHQMMMLGSSLTELLITSIPKLEYLPVVVLQGLPKLEKLRIRWCRELTSLWKMDDGGLILPKQKSCFLTSLRVLEVVGCCELVYLVPQHGEEAGTDISEEKEEEKRGQQPQYLGLPCGLERLILEHNDKLGKLPSDLHGLTSLRELKIRQCRRLSCLPEMGFPSTLESLHISECISLTGLSSSPSSMGMGRGNGMPLPHSLKHLTIRNCENLESLVGGGTALTPAISPLSLESVDIGGSPKLKSLPEGIIHRRLKHLCISGCENLGDLGISVHHLTALEDLWIGGWPAGLLSIEQGGPNSFPPNLHGLHVGGGAGPMTPYDELFSVPLPSSSLTSLWVRKFKKLSPEAFQNLSSLQSLSIWDCPGLTSIPDQLLPPSLRSLCIDGCPSLTSITDQLLPPRLTDLEIINCRGLTSIPDQLLPPSLRYLYIDGCPSLTSIIDQLLPPPRLISLEIRDCPLLAPELAKGKGRYWPKVKFIPQVIIDYRSIFDPEDEEE